MAVIGVILGYLLGSISSSTLISKWVKRIDIRQHGSGNAGATNTLRVLGVKWGILVLVLDILKGLIAVGLANLLTHGNHHAMELAGLAAILGHNWPIFFGFRGGKGVATTIGVLLVTVTDPALIAAVVAIILLVITRYVSLASLTFVILTPIVIAVLHGTTWNILFSAVVAVLCIYRHRENIVRLVQGSENKIFSRKM